MSKLYVVEVAVEFVIVADDDKHAERVAASNLRNAVSNDSLDSFHVASEIKKENDLPAGWDIGCYPYAECSTIEETIGTILDDLPPEPPARDTRTIDMFGGAA